ncbi:Conserved_hypothetical protein [Hexamita inflata]|uniref:Uncharacterized protein n=1 Tax=Hexamita inflata TaxID=28002 RepID=A0AA86PQR6_9EUKA|nr:Conserved hypothetical protein [Hexamita inflata]
MTRQMKQVMNYSLYPTVPAVNGFDDNFECSSSDAASIIPQIQQPDMDQIFDDKSNFRMIDGKQFVSCDYLFDNPGYITALTGKFTPSTNSSTISGHSHFSHRTESYVWSQQSRDIFAIAALGFGICNVTPKQILKIMHNYGLTRERVASHLQKFRIAVAKQNNVSVNDLKNWFKPTQTFLPELEYISEQWKNEAFKGFGTEDIQKLVTQYDIRQ